MLIFKSIELQKYFEAISVWAQLFEKVAVFRKTQPIGVDHQIVDRLLDGIFHHINEIWMDGRFTPGQLDHLGLAFRLNDSINRLFDLLHGTMLIPRQARSEAHRA